MYRFNQKALPLDLPALDLRLVDALTYQGDEQQVITEEFMEEFGTFLAACLPEVKLCVDNSHLEGLFTAYIDEMKALRSQGQPEPILEEWSRTNSHLYMEDFTSAPHEGVRWFELRSIASGNRVGALNISQINQTSRTANQRVLSGYAIMTLPTHPTLSYGQYWGGVLKALLDKPFVYADDPVKSFVFDEWIFPAGRKSRYVSRPGFSFGEDIATAASNGTLIEREDESMEFAPRNIRKTARGA